MGKEWVCGMGSGWWGKDVGVYGMCENEDWMSNFRDIFKNMEGCVWVCLCYGNFGKGGSSLHISLDSLIIIIIIIYVREREKER